MGKTDFIPANQDASGPPLEPDWGKSRRSLVLTSFYVSHPRPLQPHRADDPGGQEWLSAHGCFLLALSAVTLAAPDALGPLPIAGQIGSSFLLILHWVSSLGLSILRFAWSPSWENVSF